MNYQGNDDLKFLEESAPGYNKFLVREFVKKILEISGSDKQILDFGAGIGTLSLLLRDVYGIKADCLEIDENQAKEVRLRGFRCFTNIQDLDKTYSFVFMSNVLEHIDDDVEILIQIREKILKPHGCLAIYVPAFQCLFSDADRRVGHFRRYAKGELENKIKVAGFTIRESRYIDSLGYLSLFILKYILRSQPTLQKAAPVIQLYDRFIFPVSRLLDSLGMKKFAGKNILLIAQT